MVNVFSSGESAEHDISVNETVENVEKLEVSEGSGNEIESMETHASSKLFGVITMKQFAEVRLTREHCFLAMFPKDGLTRKHCSQRWTSIASAMKITSEEKQTFLLASKPFCRNNLLVCSKHENCFVKYIICRYSKRGRSSSENCRPWKRLLGGKINFLSSQFLRKVTSKFCNSVFC